MASTTNSFSVSPSVFPLMGVAMTNATALLLSTANSEPNSQNTILGSTAVGLGGASVVVLLLMYLKGNGPSATVVKEKLNAIFLPIVQSPTKFLEFLKNPKNAFTQLNTLIIKEEPVEDAKPSSAKPVEAGSLVPGSTKKTKKVVKKTVPKETVVAVVKPKVVVKKTTNTLVKKAVPQTKKLNSEIYNDITTTIPVKEGDIFVGAVKKTKSSKKQNVDAHVITVNDTLEENNEEIVEVLEKEEDVVEGETIDVEVEEEAEEEAEEEEAEEEEAEEGEEEKEEEVEEEEEEEELVTLPGSTQELVKIEFDKAHLEEITVVLNAMKKQYSVLT